LTVESVADARTELDLVVELVIEVDTAVFTHDHALVVGRAQVETEVPELSHDFDLVFPNHDIEFGFAHLTPLERVLVLNEFVWVSHEAEVVGLVFVLVFFEDPVALERVEHLFLALDRNAQPFVLHEVIEFELSRIFGEQLLLAAQGCSGDAYDCTEFFEQIHVALAGGGLVEQHVFGFLVVQNLQLLFVVFVDLILHFV